MSVCPVLDFSSPLFGQAPLSLCSLRSADVSTYMVSQKLSSYSDKTFAAAGSRLWKERIQPLLDTVNQEIEAKPEIYARIEIRAEGPTILY